ncbi:hypothetical protein, partial [Colwellia marinimaniae]|uniref:hypothetical protein n=2 Tax=Colwellia TaxID=28228 RepID=UPI0013564DA0
VLFSVYRVYIERYHFHVPPIMLITTHYFLSVIRQGYRVISHGKVTVLFSVYRVYIERYHFHVPPIHVNYYSLFFVGYKAGLPCYFSWQSNSAI